MIDPLSTQVSRLQISPGNLPEARSTGSAIYGLGGQLRGKVVIIVYTPSCLGLGFPLITSLNLKVFDGPHMRLGILLIPLMLFKVKVIGYWNNLLLVNVILL